jgi:hypothetical protein
MKLVDCYYKKILSQREGKGVTRTDINKYKELATKALAVGKPIIKYSRIWQ